MKNLVISLLLALIAQFSWAQEEAPLDQFAVLVEANQLESKMNDPFYDPELTELFDNLSPSLNRILGEKKYIDKSKSPVPKVISSIKYRGAGKYDKRLLKLLYEQSNRVRFTYIDDMELIADIIETLPSKDALPESRECVEGFEKRLTSRALYAADGKSASRSEASREHYRDRDGFLLFKGVEIRNDLIAKLRAGQQLGIGDEYLLKSINRSLDAAPKSFHRLVEAYEFYGEAEGRLLEIKKKIQPKLRSLLGEQN